MNPERDGGVRRSDAERERMADAPTARFRRGDAGRRASSARARRYASLLQPVVAALVGQVGRTHGALAREFTRLGIRKPRGGTVWTPVEVGKLLQRIERDAR